ncbi:MAG: hypothetical protein J1G02_02655 [Clostridiales bacterium]|nr:hypothetical protein [Clostridiales bacterium]
MTQQELFNCATESYQKARGLVSKMNEVVASVRKDFNPKAGYLKLDIIVQYMLLETALADGKFLPIEGEFIDKITDSFDVINLFKDVPQGMNWKWFALNRNYSHIKDTIVRLRSMAQEQMQDFASMFALVDAAFEDYDILGEMLGYLGEIAGCFTRIDGSHDEREVEIATAVVTEFLTKPWLAMMDKVKK